MGGIEGDWKKWPPGDQTVYDDFIAQGSDVWDSVWRESVNFISSGKSAAAWYKAVNAADLFVRNYATIPKNYLEAGSGVNFTGEFLTQKALTDFYNVIVSIVKDVIHDSMTKDEALAEMNALWGLKNYSLWVIPIASKWVKEGGTISQIYEKLGAYMSPVRSAQQYKDVLASVDDDGDMKMPDGFDPDVVIKDLKDIYSVSVNIAAWPSAMLSEPVVIVRDELTNDIKVDDIADDVVVVGVGGGAGGALLDTAKKYALPIGLAVAGLFLLS